MAGRLKVFLGMAAGVGKTYRMLQEGQAELVAGRDVVVGYLEPHDRPETSEQARGLEFVPRREVTVRGAVTTEMDLPALLARDPELALIDELAHTNPAGLEHAKRYEDIAAALAAGIDVFSTVNVQHLESLNDQVAELTGVRVRETVPDSVLGGADEVVLIDLTPEALIGRLREGKIYPGDSNIASALDNFFRIENLAALREVSLRQVAEDVERRVRLAGDSAAPVGTRGEERVAAEVPKAVGERLLALVRPQPSSQRLVRRAWRSAQRLGTDLDLLWVKPPGAPIDGECERQVTALRRLASVLGATFLIEENDDVVAGAARVVRERGSTYIMVGESEPARGLARLREPLPQRLMRATPPGVDVRIVAHRRGEEDR
jgi:two-component system sensor histidine kinase KdpD